MPRIILIFSLICLLILSPQAQETPESLTPEQLKQLQACERKNNPELGRIGQAIKQKKLELVKKVRSKNFNENQVRSIVDDIIELEREKQYVHIRSMAECRKILNEEQWHNFQETFIRKILQTK